MIEIEIEPAAVQQLGADRVGQMYKYIEDLPYELMVDQNVNAVNNAVDALTTLNDLRDVIVETTGDLDPTQQRLAQITLEGIRRSTGLESLPVLSLESVNNKQVALEGIGDMIKAIWNAIFNTLRAIWNAITGLFMSKKQRERLDNAQRSLKEFEKTASQLPVAMVMNERLMRPFQYAEVSEMDEADIDRLVGHYEQFARSLRRPIAVLKSSFKDLDSWLDEVVAGKVDAEKVDSALTREFASIQHETFPDHVNNVNMYDGMEAAEGAMVYVAQRLTRGNTPALFVSSQLPLGVRMGQLYYKPKTTDSQSKDSLTIQDLSKFNVFVQHTKDFDIVLDETIDLYSDMVQASLAQEKRIAEVVDHLAVQGNDSQRTAHRALQNAYRAISEMNGQVQSYLMWLNTSLEDCVALAEHAATWVEANQKADKKIDEALRTAAAV